jgi:hypothetical protein
MSGKENAMSIELTAEQQRALTEGGPFPPQVVDPRTNETYVLLPTEFYERVRAMLEEEDEIAAVRETYPVVSSILDADEAGGSSRESA